LVEKLTQDGIFHRVNYIRAPVESKHFRFAIFDKVQSCIMWR
jgi:hypothetical protein